MKRSRLLLISPAYSPQYHPLSTHVKGIAEAVLSEESLIQSVFVLLQPSSRTPDAAKKHEVSNRVQILRPLAKGVRAWLQFYSYLRAVRADIIHVHGLSIPLALVLLFIPKCIVILSWQPSAEKRWSKILKAPLYKYLLRRRVSQIITSSQSLMQSSTLLAAHQSKLQYISLGTHPRHYPVPESTSAPHGFKRYILVFVEGKKDAGLSVFLNAIHGLKIPCVVICNTSATPPIEKSEWIRYCRPQSIVELATYLCHADFIVDPSLCPSQLSDWSRLWAMLYHRPVLGTAVSMDLPFLVQDGRSGTLVEPGSVKELRAGIIQLWDMDADKKTALGNRGYRRLRTRFREDQSLEKIRECYHSFLLPASLEI